MGRKRKCETISNESSNSSVQTHLSGSQRSAANDRERTRMRVLSKAFVRLKTSLPWVPSDTKLSKLDTLKLATSYISYLSNILDEDDNNKSISLDVNQPIKLIENIKSSSMEKFKKFTPVVSNHYPYQNTSTNTTINNNSPNGYVKKVSNILGLACLFANWSGTDDRFWYFSFSDL